LILLTVTVIGCIFAVVMMPKRISYFEMYATYYFAPFLAVLADIYLDLKLNLYGFFDPGINYQYIPIFFIVYPAFNLLFLNFFPFQTSLVRKIRYILLVSLFTVGFEYVATFSEVFYHNGWKLWYSAVAYPFLYTLLLSNLLMIRKLNRKK